MPGSLETERRAVFEVLCAALLLSLAVTGCARRVEPRAELTVESNAAGAAQPAGFVVSGLSPAELDVLGVCNAEELTALLQVFVVGDLTDPPPLAGTVTLDGDRLRFTPRYALEPGVRYRAVMHRGKHDLTAELQMPARPARPATSVTHVYPTSDRLPENQLKFYIHFSAPMGGGQAYQHIHLLDETGEEVPGAFLELGQELWDRPFQRFTLLLDPGRVKRGLKPREEFGPVLEAGHRYTLAIDSVWPDAEGNPLADKHEKSFEVLPPVETPLDTTAWKIEPPPANTSAPLVVRFPRPLDHALAERMLRVADSSDKTVAGEIELTDNETGWHFTPSQPWPAGHYQLIADTRLEDLAGNSIGRAFDVDVTEAVEQTIETKTVGIAFEVK